MSNDEHRIAEIEARVRKTFNTAGKGRISREDFEYLLTSRTSWRLTAKHSSSLAQMTPTEQCEVLQKALEAEIAAHLRTQDELEKLRTARAS